MYGLPDSFVGGTTKRIVKAIKPGKRRGYFYTDMLIEAIRWAEKKALEEQQSKVQFREEEEE